jgi:glycine/D-amino acid oxidase-like deaminating enzyme
MKPIAVIGAGITGLTAAFYLKRAGFAGDRLSRPATAPAA